MKTTYDLPYDRISQGDQRYTNSRPRLRTVSFHGIPCSIEIEAGQTKSGIGEDGKRWINKYRIPYGEIPSTHATSDGDPVDVYLGPDLSATMVYVIHQVNRQGKFDEDKCMLNFSSQGDAVKAYKQHGPSWGFGSMDTMTIDQFIHGYLASNRKV